MPFSLRMRARSLRWVASTSGWRALPASIGLAQEAQVGVKHSSTLFFFAQRRMSAPVWAERLSRMMQIGAPSGRAARIDCRAARLLAVPLG